MTDYTLPVALLALLLGVPAWRLVARRRRLRARIDTEAQVSIREPDRVVDLSHLVVRRLSQEGMSRVERERAKPAPLRLVVGEREAGEG